MSGDKASEIDSIDSRDELTKFEKVFDVIMGECILDESNSGPDIADVMTHFKEVCHYNVPYGKKNRGLALVTTFRYLIPYPSDEDLFRARVLGWCIEWLQAYFLVDDDIMDKSTSRRGRKCWYKNERIGMMAINDAFFIEAMIYKILKKYFRSQPYYGDVLDLFQETTSQTLTGQGLDLLTAEDTVVDFSKFTMERYDAIVKWKTAYYSFYLPVALALEMAGVKDNAAYDEAKKILLHMGNFFQIQDDYLDCFGESAVTGKIGTDIEDNKCSWLIIQALLLSTDKQKAILETHYAKKDPESVKKVKQIYLDLDLRKVYRDYEEAAYQNLMLEINELSHPDLPCELFISFAQVIFKRIK